MKRPDDLIPEEQDPRFEELNTLLQHANLNPVIVDPQERARVISRTSARLFSTDLEIEDLPTTKLNVLGSYPGKPNALIDKPKRRGRLLGLVSAFAAVLVVVALIGSSLLLFGLWSPFHQSGSGTAPPIGPVGSPVVVSTQVRGLEMTMKITPGPYFLGELLEVDISLTNHTQTTFQGDICHLIPKLIMIDGEGLRDTGLERALTAINQNFGVKKFPHGTSLASAFATIYAHNYLPPCNIIDLTFLRQLQPTKSIAITGYVVLTKSGHVTLAARAAFQRAIPGQNGRVTLVSIASPLDGHWPSLQIWVSTQVPPDRILSLHQQPTKAIVDVPLTVRSQLFYAFSFTCTFGDSGIGTIVGNEVGKYFLTGHQPTFTLQRPGCNFSSNKSLNWNYVFGAIGYTVTAGMYSY